MSYLDFKMQQTMSQYKVLGIMLLVILLLGRYWTAHQDQIIEESHTSAEVHSVTTPGDNTGNGMGVGTGKTFAKVKLESGESARILLSGTPPAAGARVEVKMTKFASGKIRITASDAF